MPSHATNAATRREWRELGFFYSRDDEALEWRLVGSRSGLLRFRDLLLAFVDDEKNAMPSEHEHYGPYGYLEVMTWPSAGFDDHAIRGNLKDLDRLAALVDSKLSTASADSSVYIRTEFAEDSPYTLVLEVRDAGFDPAAADPALPEEASDEHNQDEPS